MGNKKVRILYIDDEVNNLNAFKATFRRQHDIYTAPNVLEARKILKDISLHIIIADQRMPGTTGIEFFNNIKEKYPDPIRILLTGYTDVEDIIDAINKGQIYRFIRKPWDDYDLQNTINNAYEIYTTKKELEKNIKELESANNELGRFINNISHSVHSPLLSALGIINLSKSDESVTDPNGYLDMIEKSIQRVESYVQRVSEYYTNLKLHSEYEKMNFRSFIHNCIEACKDQQNKVEFILKVQQEDDFYGDTFRIGIILNNLISNAIKYQNPENNDQTVNISAIIKDNTATISIEDNGKGISDEHLNKLSKMFLYNQKVNSPGSGLGLYIAKEALTRINGQILIFSEEGKGSKFTITIPGQIPK